MYATFMESRQTNWKVFVPGLGLRPTPADCGPAPGRLLGLSQEEPETSTKLDTPADSTAVFHRVNILLSLLLKS